MRKLICVQKSNYPHVKSLHNLTHVTKSELSPVQLDHYFPFDFSVRKQNNTLTFLQNGQVVLEKTITVLSLILCSIRSFTGAILLGSSGEGVLARFRLDTTKPMVENNK